MALSNTNTFTVSASEIINSSLRILGVLGLGESPTPEDETNCLMALNIMIKGWSKNNLPTFVTTEVSIPLLEGVRDYPLGASGGILTADSLTISNAGTGGINGTYALSITDAEGSGSGATGTYTISGNRLTVVTLTSPGTNYKKPILGPLTNSVGGAANIYLYGAATPNPLRYENATINHVLGHQTNLTEMSRSNWVMLNNKDNNGVPTQFYFDELVGTSYVRLSSNPTTSGDVLVGQIQRQFYDMSTLSDNFDFPSSWFQALKWGLAAELALEYGVDQQLLGVFEQKAATALMDCFDDSLEQSSIYFTVGGSYGRG
jgi:hypothetical protein